METVVVAAHHRNHHHYYGRNRGHVSFKFRSFGSPPSGNFRGINCRTFQAGEGLLPTPFSPQTPPPSLEERPKNSNRIAKSSSIPIPIKTKFDDKEGEFYFSERWAGPAYSNSPPPSSLPIPKFSVRPKRTVSLDLPAVASEIDLHPISYSAPASPVGQHSPSRSDMFDSPVSATKTLRRILNLDITDE